MSNFLNTSGIYMDIPYRLVLIFAYIQDLMVNIINTIFLSLFIVFQVGRTFMKLTTRNLCENQFEIIKMSKENRWKMDYRVINFSM